MQRILACLAVLAVTWLGITAETSQLDSPAASSRSAGPDLVGIIIGIGHGTAQLAHLAHAQELHIH